MEHLDYIEPSLNMRLLKRKLLDPKISRRKKAKLLMGLRYKLYHLPSREMARFLEKGGYPREIVELGAATAKRCNICVPWMSTLTKPVSAGGTLATFFGGRVQTDLFELWSRTYVIWIDST